MDAALRRHALRKLRFPRPDRQPASASRYLNLNESYQNFNDIILNFKVCSYFQNHDTMSSKFFEINECYPNFKDIIQISIFTISMILSKFQRNLSKFQ